MIRPSSSHCSRPRSFVTALGFAALALASVATVACGSPTPADPTPVKTFKITPAPDGATTPTPPPPTAAPSPSGSPVAGVVLELVAANSLFDLEELEAPAGSITIRLDNQDSGVVHNVSVFPGSAAAGDPLAFTELETGPVQQELVVELQPGEYHYQCDAHPTTMKGTLTVSG